VFHILDENKTLCLSWFVYAKRRPI